MDKVVHIRHGQSSPFDHSFRVKLQLVQILSINNIELVIRIHISNFLTRWKIQFTEAT
jgi:hypothetical protein